MSTTNHRCKGSLKIFAASQGYPKFLFMLLKAFKAEEHAAMDDFSFEADFLSWTRCGINFLWACQFVIARAR
jgi:hypothetical protein